MLMKLGHDNEIDKLIEDGHTVRIHAHSTLDSMKYDQIISVDGGPLQRVDGSPLTEEELREVWDSLKEPPTVYRRVVAIQTSSPEEWDAGEFLRRVLSQTEESEKSEARINLTRHESTPEQGCIPRSKEQSKQIQDLLTFEKVPGLEEVVRRARALADIGLQAGASEAMIGGAPYLMEALPPILRMNGITPVYAFSRRESVEEVQEDGSVVKRTVFRHLGFVRFDNPCEETGHKWEPEHSSGGVTYLRCRICGADRECW